jgi:NB-ARC domain-containing protein
MWARARRLHLLLCEVWRLDRYVDQACRVQPDKHQLYLPGQSSAGEILADVIFVVDALGVWLVESVADACRKRLTPLIVGSELERAVYKSVKAAVERTVDELSPDGAAQAQELALVVGEVLGQPTESPLVGQATLLEDVQAGVATRLAVLDDPELTGVQLSSAELLGISVGLLTQKLTGNFVAEIINRGARGGPLEPLSNQLSHNMTQLHLQQLEDLVGELAGQLAGLRLPQRMPPPPVPEQFVERRILAGQILDLLRPVGEGGQVISLVGMAGVGKSTLAQWVASRPEIKTRYGHRVFWADMSGQSADALGAWQESVLTVLGHSRSIPDVTVRKSALRNALTDVGCLIVLDNISDVAQFEAFDVVAGTESAILLTTRDLDVHRFGVNRVEVKPFDLDDPQERADSRKLLESYAGGRASEPLARADKVIEKCNGLPLALAICGALAREEDLSWSDIIAILDARELEKLAMRFTSYPHRSLLDAIATSLSRLDPHTQERFCELAVFAGKGPVPMAAAAKLWSCEGVTDSQARDYIELLARRSLLRYFRRSATFLLHDLMLDYAASGIGSGLPALHAQIADAYLQSWGGIAAGLPGLGNVAGLHGDDANGYGLAHVVSHLAAAGQDNLLHALLAAEAPDGPDENRWFVAQDQAGRANQYLHDVDRAWQIAREATDRSLTPEDLAIGVGLEMRYALIKGSLTSLAASVPVPLMIALVRQGVWSFPKGWAFAVGLHPMQDRARVLRELLQRPNLARSDRRQLLTDARQAAEAVELAADRAWALATLIPTPQMHAADRLSLFEAVMTATSDPSLARTRAWILARAARYLPKQVSQELMSSVRSGLDTFADLRALAVAAPHLTQDDAQQLRDDLITRAPELEDPSDRLTVITAALACSSESDRNGLLSDARRALAQLPPPSERVRPWATAVTQLAPYLTEGDLHELLNIALELTDRHAFRDEVLVALLPYLREPDLSIAGDTVMNAMREVGFRGDRDILAAVLLRLPDTKRTQLIDEIVQDDKRAHDIWVLCALARYLPDHLLAHAVDAACALRPESRRADALEKLAPVLSPPLLKRALVAVTHIDTPEDRASVLVNLSPLLPDRLIPAALAAVSIVPDPAKRSRLLAELAPHLRPSLLSAALSAIPQQADPEPLTDCLVELGRRAPDAERAALHARALEAACLLQPPRNRENRELSELFPLAVGLSGLADLIALRRALTRHHWASEIPALQGIVSKLPRDLLAKAVEIVLSWENPCNRSCALSALIPSVSEEDRPLLLLEALKSAFAWHNHDDATHCPIEKQLTQAATHVPAHERLPLPPGISLEECDDEDPDPRDPYRRLRQLTCLAAYLTPPQRKLAVEAAFDAVRLIRTQDQLRILIGLAPHMSSAQRAQTVKLVEVSSMSWEKNNALLAIGLHAPEQERSAIFDRAMAADQDDPSVLISSLTRLSPHLASSSRKKLCAKGLQAISRANASDESKADLIRRIAPHLAADQFSYAADMAQSIATPRHRAVASIMLAASRDPREPDYWSRYCRNALANAAAAGRSWLLSTAAGLCLAAASHGDAQKPELIATYLADAICDVQRWWPGGSQSPPSKSEMMADLIAGMIDSAMDDSDESEREAWMSAD